jgi:hypothetical protein
VVVCAYNPSYLLGGGDREIFVMANSGQKVSKTLPQKTTTKKKTSQM